MSGQRPWGWGDPGIGNEASCSLTMGGGVGVGASSLGGKVHINVVTRPSRPARIGATVPEATVPEEREPGVLRAWVLAFRSKGGSSSRGALLNRHVLRGRAAARAKQSPNLVPPKRVGQGAGPPSLEGPPPGCRWSLVGFGGGHSNRGSPGDQARSGEVGGMGMEQRRGKQREKDGGGLERRKRKILEMHAHGPQPLGAYCLCRPRTHHDQAS